MLIIYRITFLLHLSGILPVMISFNSKINLISCFWMI